jgi:hypothetical protein
MLITLDLSARQIASLLRQTATKPAKAKRPMTDHRREYQKLLMRKRRAAAKAEAA